MIRSIFFVAFSFLLLSCANAFDNKQCTAEEASQAEDAVDTLKDWNSVYQVFKHFGHCDDGAISEGYSDAVGHLLADDWGQIKRLQILCSSDKRFKRFVMKHIDGTVPVDVLQKIVNNTRLQCPADVKGLCKEIERAASAGWKPNLK